MEAIHTRFILGAAYVSVFGLQQHFEEKSKGSSSLEKQVYQALSQEIEERFFSSSLDALQSKSQWGFQIRQSLQPLIG